MLTLTEKVSGIYHALVYVNDEGAIKKFLEPMPQEIAQAIERQLKSPAKKEAMKWDEETGRAFFVRCDGKVAECWTWNEVPSLVAAATMWTVIVQADRPMNFALAKEAFATVSEAEVVAVQ